MDYILFFIALLLPGGAAAYFGYIYYTYTYKSEERLLRVTRFQARRVKHGYVYHVIGEMTDIPGMELRSIESYTPGELKYAEGDVIPVRYIKGNRFVIAPNRFLYSALIMMLVAVIAFVAVIINIRSRTGG